jgi:hypothetical protein
MDATTALATSGPLLLAALVAVAAGLRGAGRSR